MPHSDSVLVTGGAGFIGSYVARRLVAEGKRVVILDDLSGGFRRNVPAGAELRVGSTTNPEAVAGLFRRYRFRHVYDLAAYAAEGLSPFIRRFNYTTNLIGSVNLINAAVNHEVECFVFISSIAVYGASRGPFTETMAVAPIDPYGIAKAAVEQDLRAAGELFGLRHVVFRPHNVYGEGQNLSDPYRNVIGIFLRQTLAGRPCTIFGDGSQTRAFSHVDDVAGPIALCVDVPQAWNRTFNIGSDEAHPVSHVAEVVQRALGRDVGIERLPARHEVRHAVSDHARAKRVFELGDGIDLEQGILRMAGWAREVEIAPSRAVSRLEISRDLPPSWVEFSEPAPETSDP